MLTDYLPVIVQLLLAGGFAAFALVATHILGPKVHNAIKDDTYECGVDYKGNARFQFAIKFYLIAVLFVLFDIEVVFLYPWAINLRALGWNGFWAMMIFLGVLTLGLVFAWRKGALEWE
ncbi:MAG: NADH-quinone oxidoreductase subunit A [bacterium]|nr:NADH-quinone oxidoreductase subunit A [bacterium]